MAANQLWISGLTGFTTRFLFFVPSSAHAPFFSLHPIDEKIV
jgi:hypothetical protein